MAEKIALESSEKGMNAENFGFLPLIRIFPVFILMLAAHA
jgi:hypothetical protein